MRVSGLSAAPDPGAAERGGAGRRAAGAALAVSGGALAVVVLLTTPWRPLDAPPVAPDPAADFTAAERARAAAFDAAVSVPSYLSLAVTLVVAGLLVLTPLGARLTGRLRGPWWLRVLVGVLIVAAVPLVLRWPLGMWYEVRLREYGLSTQTWAGWSADRLKSFGVNTALTAAGVLAVVALARRWPRRWWLPGAAGAFALTVVVSFLYPVVVEPLFHDFRPLPPGRLRTELLDLAARDGVPVREVLVADASRRTTARNAYVSGFGATRRIVVYDTLLTAPEPEVKLIVAHELGHARHGDVWQGTLVGGLGAAAGVCLLFLVVSGRSVRRRAGVTGPADPRAAGLLVGLISLGMVLSAPGQNLVGRQLERRADAHALELTGDPATFVAMQRMLAVSNLSDLDPDLFEYAMYASHPTAPERIAMARAYARHKGLPRP